MAGGEHSLSCAWARLRAGSPVNEDQAFEGRKETEGKKERKSARSEREGKQVETTEEKKGEARAEQLRSEETNWGIARQPR